MRAWCFLAVLLCACSEQRVVLMAANQELLEGTELERAHVVEVKVSSVLATPNAVKPEQVQALFGKRLRIPLQKGDLLLSSYFEHNQNVSTLVMKKARAVTLAVSGAENVHFGDHVDLIALVKDPALNDWVATTHTQNVVVLSPGAFDPAKEKEAFPLRRVTFLLLSEEAEAALLAVRIGGLHVSLRNEDDLDVQEERGRATIHSLLSEERKRVLEQKRVNILAAPTPQPVPADDAPVPTLPGKQE